MIENYKLNKLVDPSGVAAGYILLLFGLITIYFTLTAIPVLLIGSVMAFSYSGTRINLTRRRYQKYVMLLGIIRTGIWLPFEKSDKIMIEDYKGKYTSYSRSNRKSEIAIQDHRLFMRSDYYRKKIPLARFDNKQEAQRKVQELQNMIDSL